MSSLRHIVFIPGWGFQPSIANHFFPECTQFIDLPLLKGNHNTMETLCLTIEEKIQPKGTILLGWSFGGLIAINLYSRHPNSYKGLILMASTPCFRAQANWPGISKSHESLFMCNLNREYNTFAAYYLRLISEPFQFSKMSLDIQSHMIHKHHFNNHKFYTKILFKMDLRSEFSSIKIPTLVIQGEKDVIIPTGLNKYLRKLNPHLKYWSMPNAGHIPFIPHQNETNKIIRTFLREFS